MNRYLTYLILMPFAGATAVEQVILLDTAYRGALMSILLAFCAGTLLTIFAVKLFSRFPRQGLPEIADGLMPRPPAAMLLLLQSALWFLTGVFPLLYMTEVSKRYVNPDYVSSEPLALFLAVIVLLVNIPSVKLLYYLEIILVMTVPFLYILCVKAYFSEQLMFYSMMEAASRIVETPTLTAFSAAMLLFSGCLVLTVFNRVMAPDVTRIWKAMLVAFVGFLFLLTAFFIPIGLFGADGVKYINYPMFSASDALLMKYGFIDRVLFVGLPLNILTTLVYTLLMWHVGLEHWKAVWRPAGSAGTAGSGGTAWRSVLIAYAPIVLIAAALLIVETRFGFSRIINYAVYWNWLHLFNALLILALLGFAALRASRQKAGQNAKGAGG